MRHQVSRAVMRETEPRSSASDSQQEKPPAVAAPKSVKAIHSQLKQPARTRAERTVVEVPQNMRSPADPSHETVTTDSATVYSFNYTGSSIVHVLRKGDTVETKLEVVDSKGRWQLIRAGDNSSGFVRSETLEDKAPRRNISLSVVR